jgi:hypothetical protein
MGVKVGVLVGDAVVGVKVGILVGDAVGRGVSGASLGSAVGCSVLGGRVGKAVGRLVALVGADDGLRVWLGLGLSTNPVGATLALTVQTTTKSCKRSSLIFSVDTR